MDAFCLNAGAPGTLPSEPGPTTYLPKYIRKHANPSPVRYVKPRPRKNNDNGIPGPASYTFPDGLGKQPLSQYRSPTSIKMANSKRVSLFTFDGSVPGPNAYGILSLPSHGGGVQFGPAGGHKEFNRPRSVRPSQQAAMEANTRRPGPGAYHILSSLGRQVESNKPSPGSVSFGSSTRKQRKKMYMGHGVTTVEATLGEGAGYKYSHPDIPYVLRPHSPSVHFGRNVVKGDMRLLRVRQRREALEAELIEMKLAEKVRQTPKSSQRGSTAASRMENYDWLRPSTVFGGSRQGSRKKERAQTAKDMMRKRFGSAELPRSRPFSRDPTPKFSTGRRFNNKIHMPHSPSTAVGLTAPGPQYDLPELPTSPGAYFPEFTKRTVEIWQDRVKFENIPGPGAYNTSIEQRMNAITERRDEVNKERHHLEYQVKERLSLVEESKDIVESTAAKIVQLEKDVNTYNNQMIDLNEKQVKAEERKRKLDAAKAKRKRKEEKKAIKLGLKIPKMDDEEDDEEMTPLEIEIDDLQRKIQSNVRSISLEKRSLKSAKLEYQQCQADYISIQRQMHRINREANRLNQPARDVISMKYGTDPRVKTPGSVCMALGTREDSRKMHQPNMKVNPMATLDNPGPGSYNVAGRGLDTDGGVRFSTAFPMDDVEWVMLRASRLPAPNEYKPVPVQGKSPLSSIRSAPSLVFATAGRDARKKWYFPGAPSDALGTESPGPQYVGRSTIGPQVLSTMRNSTVIKIFSGKSGGEQSTVDAVPGPGAYRPPHQVYSSAVKRLRRKSPLDANKPIVKASKYYKVGGKNRQDRSSHVDSKWIKAHKKKG